MEIGINIFFYIQTGKDVNYTRSVHHLYRLQSNIRIYVQVDNVTLTINRTEIETILNRL